MVKNTKGGKHHKKGKKRREEKSDGKIMYAEQNQVYAAVTKKVGGSRILVNCSDTKDRSGLIPGKFFKRVWLNEGDILLCELNPSDDTQCYIVHKYSYKDASLLKSQGRITFNVIEDESDNNGYDFADKDDADDEEYVDPNKMLDINNVKIKSSGKKKNQDNSSSNDSDNDDDLIANDNHSVAISSTKWSAKKAAERKQEREKEKAAVEEDKKEYTIDDL